MSSYTTELRYICEVAAGYDESQGGSSIADIISNARESIFDFNYPIFDDEYKEVLETKIIKHYYTREISEETVGLWKLRLDDKMNMIMPYYNKLYRSELLEFNPFYDVDLTRDRKIESDGQHSVSEVGKRDRNEDREVSRNRSAESANSEISKIENKGEDSSSNSASSTEKNTEQNSVNRDTSGSESNTAGRWDLYSDTPQGGVNGLIGNGGSNIGDNYYLTNVRKIDDNSQKINSGESSESGESTGEKFSNGVGNSFSESKTESSGNVQNIGSASENIEENSSIDENENTSRNEIKNMSNLEDYIEHVKGKQGSASYSKMLEEFRQTFLNIDAMIIQELSPLFFGLW